MASSSSSALLLGAKVYHYKVIRIIKAYTALNHCLPYAIGNNKQHRVFTNNILSKMTHWVNVFRPQEKDWHLNCFNCGPNITDLGQQPLVANDTVSATHNNYFCTRECMWFCIYVTWIQKDLPYSSATMRNEVHRRHKSVGSNYLLK